jgi:hypothetical protein
MLGLGRLNGQYQRIALNHGNDLVRAETGQHIRPSSTTKIVNDWLRVW